MFKRILIAFDKILFGNQKRDTEKTIPSRKSLETIMENIDEVTETLVDIVRIRKLESDIEDSLHCNNYQEALNYAYEVYKLYYDKYSRLNGSKKEYVRGRLKLYSQLIEDLNVRITLGEKEDETNNH